MGKKIVYDLRTVMIFVRYAPGQSVTNFYFIPELLLIFHQTGIVHVAVRILYE